jgi:tripartite-type tricarboxylate transporter receptor subunit TctC
LSFAQAPAFDAMRIMIPAGPGGGFDQTGRSLGAALQSAGLTKSVQYENKGGAGGTIGLAQFLNTDKASPNALIVAGLVTVGAVHLNKTPVSLSNVTPIALPPRRSQCDRGASSLQDHEYPRPDGGNQSQPGRCGVCWRISRRG